MQLNTAALNRLVGASFNAETTAALYGLLAAQADVFGSPSGTLTLDYHQPGDAIEPGDLIPVITFTLRPYHLHEYQESNPSVPSGPVEQSGKADSPSANAAGCDNAQPDNGG